MIVLPPIAPSLTIAGQNAARLSAMLEQIPMPAADDEAAVMLDVRHKSIAMAECIAWLVSRENKRRAADTDELWTPRNDPDRRHDERVADALLAGSVGL